MRFHHEQRVSAPQERVAEFFRDASNLLKITPPFPRASIRGESRVFDGAVIGLVLSAGPFTARWDSMIERVDPDGTFVDVSRTPFFRRWRHTHRFVPDGAGCRIVDEVEAEPSLWFAPVAGLFVRSLFAYRKRALRRVFQ